MKFVLSISLLLLLTALAPAQEKLKHAADLYRAGKYAEAIVEIDKLNSSGEGNHQSYLYLGAAYTQLGKDDEARAAFIKAKKLKIVKDIDGETPIKFTKKTPPGSKGVPDKYQSGTTVLAVEFRADESVGFTFVVQTTTKEFVFNCIEAAREIEFEPATSKGTAVSIIKLVEYTFKRY